MYVASITMIWEEIDLVLTASHCMTTELLLSRAEASKSSYIGDSNQPI